VWRDADDRTVTSGLDIATQIDIGLRLLLATLLGGAIGYEREMHDHPAGVRTHLLVSLGSAMFTVVSVYGFVSDPGAGNVDPTRIAAQIVSGIGFLGAGAIIKYGTSIFGLTTAGSLWATAAVGMAAGAGMPLVAVAGAAIVLFSLWPLHRLVSSTRGDDLVRLRLRLRGVEPLGRVTTEIARMHAELVEVESERTAKNRYEVRLAIRPRAGTPADAVIPHLAAINDVELVEATAPDASPTVREPAAPPTDGKARPRATRGRSGDADARVPEGVQGGRASTILPE
jgi:putative Mg2+ transporter-C (MgtC) family protein